MTTTKELIKKHEGIRLRPYKDSVGILTVGVGHNLEANGISVAVAELMLEEDIAIAVNELKDIFEEWEEIQESVKSVLIDMMFNLGYTRFSKFKRMIGAIRIQDYKLAAKEATDSKWCEQVGARCTENYNILMEA